ncbi:serine-type peptidase [Aureococcus anophagefferens]|uniref:Serine-type peptidase n=1 Tax=Aureococcus anophagefferens TaxID=44056 RepID=A0ABR1FV26_AURAN
MVPTLQPGDVVLQDRFFTGTGFGPFFIPPKRGDLVFFEPPPALRALVETAGAAASTAATPLRGRPGPRRRRRPGAGPAAAPGRGRRAAARPLTTFLGRVVRVALRSLLWGAVVAPVVANAHPALAYVGYGREEVDVLRSESGSMGFVIPLSIAGVIVTTMRQGQRSKKEVKRIKKAYKKVQEEEAEYLKVDGEAESDADIMAQLRNRTTTMAEEEAAAEAAANAPPEPEAPPPPVKPKRMTMAEKIKAREAALGQNRTKLG